MGATNRGMLSSASFVKLFELFSMNSVSFVDSFCYHTFSAYILCSFLFDYILLCFIKKLYPTLFSLLFECMSLYCGTKPETVEQPITQTLYCNEPKNTWILKTILPLITQFSAVVRGILICFPSSIIVLIHISFFMQDLRGKQVNAHYLKPFTHTPLFPKKDKHTHTPASFCISLVNTSEYQFCLNICFCLLKITWNWGNEVTVFSLWGVLLISSSLSSLYNSFLNLDFLFIRSHFSLCWNYSTRLFFCNPPSGTVPS